MPDAERCLRVVRECGAPLTAAGKIASMSSNHRPGVDLGLLVGVDGWGRQKTFRSMRWPFPGVMAHLLGSAAPTSARQAA